MIAIMYIRIIIIRKYKKASISLYGFLPCDEVKTQGNGKGKGYMPNARNLVILDWTILIRNQKCDIVIIQRLNFL
jgi:hypothetical protein